MRSLAIGERRAALHLLLQCVSLKIGHKAEGTEINYFTPVTANKVAEWQMHNCVFISEKSPENEDCSVFVTLK